MWATDQQMALRRLAACVSLLLSLATSSAQFSVPINSLGLSGGSIESSSSGPQLTQNASSGLIQAQTPYGASTALYEANAGAYAARAAAVNTSLVTNDFQHPANITATLPRSVPNITLPPDSAIESGVGDPYDYGGVLGLSLLFYEAQRSGPAAGNRVPWRADAQMNEVSSAGTTLVGGYADAGDNLKLNFPAAFAASMLAWGLSEFPQGYANAGETDNALSALRWFGDFFVRSHHADRTFTAQCGDPGADHSTWIPIEQSATPRPCYDVKLGASGADVLGAVSAALAAISQVFAHNDTAYSNILLAHAQDLYAFAKLDPTAKYSDSIPQAYVYPSSSTYDDLAWAACWLYIRTGQATFLQEAVEHYQKLPGIATMFSWDDYGAGVALLLSTLRQGGDAQKVQQFLVSWITGTDGVQYTPKGAAWASQWGAQRYTANAALIAAIFSQRSQGNTLSPGYACWARKQIRLMLGDAGASYVIGYGATPPTQPHHRTASCPGPTAPCGFSFFNTPDPNPNVIRGALVGGPNLDGSLADMRSNYVNLEVALDYNAAFTSVLAFLGGGGIPSATSTADCTTLPPS